MSYINTDGQLAFPDKLYNTAYPFYNGFAAAKRSTRSTQWDYKESFVVIDKSGFQTAEFDSKISLNPLVSGYYAYDNSYSPNTSSPGSAYNFPGAGRHFYNPYDDGKFYFSYDQSEKEVRFSEGLVRILFQPEKLHKWEFAGFADVYGQVKVKPNSAWSMVRPFSNDRAAVRFTGMSKTFKWGFIDHSGKEVVPSKYDVVAPFKDGSAVVTTNVGGFGSV